MNVQQMVEMVRSSYPEVGATEVLAVLKTMVDSFCKRSRVMRQRVSISGTFASDLGNLSTDGLATEWTAPGYVVNVYEELDTWRANNLDIVEVNSVQYDLSLLQKYPRLSARIWTIVRNTSGFDRLVVMYYAPGADSGGKAALTTAVDIALDGVWTVAANFAWDTMGSTTLPVPAEFHVGIVYGVMAHFALTRDKDARLGSYYTSEFDKAVVLAKSRGNNVNAARGLILNDV